MLGRENLPEHDLSTSLGFMSFPLVDTAAQQQMCTQGSWNAVSTVQTHTVYCRQKQGGLLDCTTSLTRETKWVEGRKEKGQLQILGRVVSQFKEAGCLMVGEGRCVVHPASWLWKEW